MTNAFETFAHGKLLLTSEYFVLDGAEALAVPVKYGQTLRAVPNDKPVIRWASKNRSGATWFTTELSWPALNIMQTNDDQIAVALRGVIQATLRQRPDILATTAHGFDIETQTDFPRAWGLGTSSTFIAALCYWLGADPYRVLFETFGGSGYDIACAYATEPLVYSLKDQVPNQRPAHYAPAYHDQLYFVYLDRKQNSREGIQRYREYSRNFSDMSGIFSDLTARWVEAKEVNELNKVIFEHETLIESLLELPRAKDLYFSDYPDEIKSLGAWGGDFVLATSSNTEAFTRNYFVEKGFKVCIPWREMVVLPL